jgi:hypothetical protein
MAGRSNFIHRSIPSAARVSSEWRGGGLISGICPIAGSLEEEIEERSNKKLIQNVKMRVFKNSVLS